HETTNIRGNVETRIQKLNESDFDGLIMAKAAIDRLDMKLPHTLSLDWMLPAPAQGAIGIACRLDDQDVLRKLEKVNHHETFTAVQVERAFLHELKGGCSAPISAHVVLTRDGLSFNGAVHSIDGTRSFRVARTFGKSDFSDAGRYCALDVLQAPEGNSILEDIFRSRPELRDQL
ncbi:MAG TPA: hypothetical protein VF473_02260, partial [Cyclobacteriaceae bacterium]